MSRHKKCMEYLYRIFLPNIWENVGFKKRLKVVDIVHLLQIP